MFVALMKKELLALARDVHGLAALFLMPVVFIVVMSMALQDVYSPVPKKLAYAVANQDGGRIANELVKRWQRENGMRQPLPEQWRRELAAGHLQYVLLIEPGFSARMQKTTNKGQASARLLVEPGLDQALFELTRIRLVAAVAQLRAELLLAQLDLGVDVTSLIAQTPVVAERIAVGAARPTAVQQNVPAWLVFAMFFVVASIAGLFVEERGCGALARLRSLGVRPWQLVAGKMAPYLLVNGVQAALMLAVGVWLMPVIGGAGMSLAGIDWAALFLMLLAISLAAVSLALAIASLVGTHGQAMTIGPVINILMAALGGVMVPLFVMPPVMRQVAAYSPMNWGLEGLLDVLVRGGGCVTVLPMAAKLAVFALAMLLVGFAAFRRRL